MQRKLIPVKGRPDLARDAKSGAIVNINRTEIQQARQRKQLRQKKNEEIQQLKTKVDRLTEIVEQLLKEKQ